MTERHRTPEDEGIPDLQDGTPEQYWAEDPQEAAVPGDQPVAVDDYGTTADEMREGEPLDERLRREEPETTGRGTETGEPAGRIVQPDEGAHSHTEPDAVGEDVGADVGGYTAEEDAMRVDEQ